MVKRHKVLDPGATYTFSRYFELPYAPQDILADLGCTLVRTRPLLYGAVSTGEIWKFGRFDRSTRQVTEFLTLNPVPSALEFVVRSLLGILQNDGSHATLV